MTAAEKKKLLAKKKATPTINRYVSHGLLDHKEVKTWYEKKLRKAGWKKDVVLPQVGKPFTKSTLKKQYAMQERLLHDYETKQAHKEAMAFEQFKQQVLANNKDKKHPYKMTVQDDARFRPWYDDPTYYEGKNVGDAPIAKAETEEPKRSQNGNEVKHRTKLYGYAITAIIRWMGKSHWEFHEAKKVLTGLAIDVSDVTIKIQLKEGKQGGGKPPAPLTKQQRRELHKLLAK